MVDLYISTYMDGVNCLWFPCICVKLCNRPNGSVGPEQFMSPLSSTDLERHKYHKQKLGAFKPVTQTNRPHFLATIKKHCSYLP